MGIKRDRYLNDIKGKKYINTLSKYYFSDISLRNAILDMRQQEETHILENIIYNELITRSYSVDVGMVEISNEEGILTIGLFDFLLKEDSLDI